MNSNDLIERTRRYVEYRPDGSVVRCVYRPLTDAEKATMQDGMTGRTLACLVDFLNAYAEAISDSEDSFTQGKCEGLHIALSALEGFQMEPPLEITPHGVNYYQ